MEAQRKNRAPLSLALMLLATLPASGEPPAPSIFSPDLAGCERRSPPTMGALEVCAGAPGRPGLTVR